MNAITHNFGAAGPTIAQAFKPIAANVAAPAEWAGFPCLRLIELHATSLAREAVAAEEAFYSSNHDRYLKRRAALLDRFAELEAEMAEFKARINGDPIPPTEPMAVAA
jgi:hypothetical protein